MPKFVSDVVAGYGLTLTAKDRVEAVHIHAADRASLGRRKAVFYVDADGNARAEEEGTLSKGDMKKIQTYIKANYALMLKKR